MKKRTKNTIWTIAVILSIIASSIIILTHFEIKLLSLAPGTGNVFTLTSVQQETDDYKTLQFIYRSDCGDGKSNFPYGITPFEFTINSNQDQQSLPEYQPNESPFLISDTSFDSKSVTIIEGVIASAKCKVKKVGPYGSTQNCGNTPGCVCTTYQDGSTECTNGGKITYRIEVYDCQVKGNYTCNNVDGCEVPNFCDINIVFDAYKEGRSQCPTGQTKCSDGTCQISCTQPCPTGQTKCSDGVCRENCNTPPKPDYTVYIIVTILILITGGLWFLYKKSKK